MCNVPHVYLGIGHEQGHSITGWMERASGGQGKGLMIPLYLGMADAWSSRSCYSFRMDVQDHDPPSSVPLHVSLPFPGNSPAPAGHTTA